MSEAHPNGQALVLTEEQALELITFLVSAAEICLHEPVYYGTFRLVDGASRLMGMLLEHAPPTSGARCMATVDLPAPDGPPITINRGGPVSATARVASARYSRAMASGV